jgi:uncharacterized membrane protein YdjX (TVP38/TMEM64 family)
VRTSGPSATRRLALLWLGALAVLLAVFAAAELAGLPLLPSRVGAAVGVGLLAADVLLPIPSSVVMAALGAAYGLPLGAALSVLGGALMALAGGLLGRRGSRAVTGGDRARVESLVARYGVAAVVLSRPVPLLAESVLFVAAAAGMPLPRLVLGATAGTVPVALVYAAAGAYGRQADAAVAFVVIVVLALLALAVPRYWRQSSLPSGSVIMTQR